MQAQEQGTQPLYLRRYIIDDVDHMDVHASVKDLKENPQQCASVSLHQCLQVGKKTVRFGLGPLS